MNFMLSKDQIALRDAARDFAKKEIATHSVKMDRDEQLDPELLKKAAGLGYLGISIPEEYGGSFTGHLTESLVMMEIARGSAGVATTLGASSSLFGSNLAANGTEEQKRRYLPRI